MASTLLVNLEQLCQKVFGKSKETILAHTTDFSSVPKEELDNHVKTSDYCKDKIANLDFIQLATEILDDFDPNCHVEMQVTGYDAGSLEFKL